jgi:hypothetical protein
MAASHSGDVREDAEWVSGLAGTDCELRRQGKNSIVTLRSEERKLTCRVLRLKHHKENQIILEVPRFGRAKPGRLDFLRRDSRQAIPLIWLMAGGLQLHSATDTLLNYSSPERHVMASAWVRIGPADLKSSSSCNPAFYAAKKEGKRAG